MTAHLDSDRIVLRPARSGDGQALFDITWLSVKGLSTQHYSPEQIAGWMGRRDADYYEVLIGRGATTVAELDGALIGFVDAVPGEVTRLFLHPKAAGAGLGSRLLAIGIAQARRDHEGPVRVESTLNAAGFYQRHGFEVVGTGFFSHGVGGAPIEIVAMEMA
ncbi:GNAT family N-acetyltransferase [Ancylobacter sp. A5.8]|uniref:GNAT family N-acetyltransferase n=1 Tax=Ancylobacter gelatini TaxID=2919920 RepID=UPI001F4D7D8C|nr:GNAT family N-acetyltransferase [Ancylobacter gelatini]MCJ8144484.1 GNAT family N-acetyltransferase [Ancylobacter gelatini]